MKNKYFEYMLCLTLVYTMLAGGCAPAMMPGDVQLLGTGATLRGYLAVQQGLWGTHLISDGRLIVGLFPCNSHWGVFCLNSRAPDAYLDWVRLTGGRAMLMSAQDASNLVRYLIKEHAWYEVPTYTLPPVAIQGGQVVTAMGKAITGFLVVPVGMPFDQARGEPGAY